MSPYQKLSLMHAAYGVVKNKKCRDCCNHSFLNKGSTVGFCSAFGKKLDDAMEWEGNGEACGLFDKPRNNHLDGAAKTISDSFEQLKL